MLWSKREGSRRQYSTTSSPEAPAGLYPGQERAGNDCGSFRRADDAAVASITHIEDSPPPRIAGSTAHTLSRGFPIWRLLFCSNRRVHRLVRLRQLLCHAPQPPKGSPAPLLAALIRSRWLQNRRLKFRPASLILPRLWCQPRFGSGRQHDSARCARVAQW